MTVKFKNPPVNELIISTYFNPPIHGLRNEHIGLFWHSIRDKFPTVSQQLPLPPDVGVNMDAPMGQEIFPMPRYWMIASDDRNLIQIQKHAFMLNWRRRDAEYPHYEKIKPIFDKYYSKFQAFISSETNTDNLHIDVCALTYINKIEACEYWSGPEDIKTIIPSFSIPTIGLSPTEQRYNCSFSYVIDNDLQLRVSVHTAQSDRNSEIPMLILEIQASGRIESANRSENKTLADAWFDHGHQAIIDCFVKMTNPEIQNQNWMPTEHET